MIKPYFSIIIPIRVENTYLKETLVKLNRQTYKNFEILVITDKISKSPNPALKRNIGAKKANGRYLVFLDDDSYPTKKFLANIYKLSQKYPQYAGFCGPCLTPPQNNLYQQASGLVWSSWLGSGGAGVYRNSIKSARFVDDYPTVNLIIKKSDFNQVSGFDIKYWPGEDTILCLKLTHQLNKKILYHPSITVCHHRRSVFIPHLKQISRYALHRGYFAKIFPQTSFRLGYLLPSLFTFYLITSPLHKIYYLLYIYLLLLAITFIDFLFQKNSFLSAILAITTIPLTHFTYGILFIKGFLSKKITFSPHKVNQQTGHYLGG